METDAAERQAREANSPQLWNRIWRDEGEDTWRGAALAPVYERIASLIPKESRVLDVGGGIGLLAKKLADDNKCAVEVWDLSAEAVRMAERHSHVTGRVMDLEGPLQGRVAEFSYVVSTEAVEHLSEKARERLFAHAANAKGAIFSVPNNRLGPDEEPQHTIKYTALQYKRRLQEQFEHVRVEVMGPFLLGVVGELAKKDFTLSMTLPVRDEGADLEPVLASLRGVADEMIVGVDSRTTDDTWEVAERYADKVFFLENPMGPPRGHHKDDCLGCVPMRDFQSTERFPCKEYMGEDGIHFAWARNQCIEQCTGDWIFMTEGHERLLEGQDALLRLGIIPEEALVAFVARQSNGQQWAFPWLFRNHESVRFKRPVHNVLEYPEKALAVKLPNVITLHERHVHRTDERASQRKVQNRKQLMEDWVANDNQQSLYYLAQEWAALDEGRAIERYEEFLIRSNSGSPKYQARLILAKYYYSQKRIKDTYNVLHPATSEDWSRNEHWVALGDLATEEGQLEKARVFYLYAAAHIGDPPFTTWWVDLAMYQYLPAQRLAVTSAALGQLREACAWAEKAAELLPDDSPQSVVEQAQTNIRLLKETLENGNN